MTGTEIENPSLATLKTTPASEHFATTERTHKHKLVRLWNIEKFAVHLMAFELDRKLDTCRNWVLGIDSPEELPVIRLTPAQIAACTHQPAENPRKVGRVQHNQTHTVQHTVMDTLQHFIRHLIVREVTPPQQDIC